MKKGERIGLLVRTHTPAEYKTRKDGQLYPYRYKVKCDCGNVIWISHNNMQRGKANGWVMTCGCGQGNQEGLSRLGDSIHPIYNTWASMMARCYNPKHSKYADYGKRGITICQLWRHYITFYNWAMANGWNGTTQIDRFPDNDGNYCPNNCRWASRKQNNNNRRCTKGRAGSFLDFV